MRVRRSISRRTSTRSGFTLLEVTIAATIFSLLGYAVTEAVRVADYSHSTVSHVASTNRALRDTTAQVQRELKSAQTDTMTVTVGVDGNNEVTFAHPITIGANPVWGVRERRLGPNPADQNKLDWRLRYTVSDVNLGAGQVDRRLVRQVLDDMGNVQIEDVLLGGLATGPNPPAFTMTANGDVWETTLTTDNEGQDHGRQSVFQIRPRN